MMFSYHQFYPASRHCVCLILLPHKYVSYPHCTGDMNIPLSLSRVVAWVVLLMDGGVGLFVLEL